MSRWKHGIAARNLAVRRTVFSLLVYVLFTPFVFESQSSVKFVCIHLINRLSPLLNTVENGNVQYSYLKSLSHTIDAFLTRTLASYDAINDNRLLCETHGNNVIHKIYIHIIIHTHTHTECLRPRENLKILGISFIFGEISEFSWHFIRTRKIFQKIFTLMTSKQLTTQINNVFKLFYINII